MSELNRLRCQLTAVNIQYSALVRRKTGETAYARMAELRIERRSLMALIAVERQAAAMERVVEHALSSPLLSIFNGKLMACPGPSQLNHRPGGHRHNVSRERGREPIATATNVRVARTEELIPRPFLWSPKP